MYVNKLKINIYQTIWYWGIIADYSGQKKYMSVSCPQSEKNRIGREFILHWVNAKEIQSLTVLLGRRPQFNGALVKMAITWVRVDLFTTWKHQKEW